MRLLHEYERSVRQKLLVPVFTCAVVLSAMSVQANDKNPLSYWLTAPHRTPRNVARDIYRHPIETLMFFGVKDNSTVVEILPGSGGYYLELLAPYLKARGIYIAANRDELAGPRNLAGHKKLLARLKKDPVIFDKVRLTKFDADGREIAPPGTANFVLTFRNLHNWIPRDRAEGALRAFYRALKPGGVLGVVDHRGRADQSQEAQNKLGYVREDVAIELIEKAGFKLVGRSEVNANPKDRKDYPQGVWTLPPTYRLGETDRAKYQAIGESDRFTHKYVKQ